MATGGKDINQNLFNQKQTDEINKFIKNIAIIQYSQITGKCPKGHTHCLKTKCWLAEDNND